MVGWDLALREIGSSLDVVACTVVSGREIIERPSKKLKEKERKRKKKIGARIDPSRDSVRF